MLVQRIPTPGLSQVAYLVIDEDRREVAVIDPRRDVDIYLDWVRERDMRIVAVLETHIHADFISGAPELSRRSGAPVYASRLGESSIPHYPIDDGDEVVVGDGMLRALHTPGHTPEHLAYLLFDPGTDTPRALFSGDVLFVGEIGRPDLLGEEATDRLVNQLYETVTRRLATLPDELKVYPGHTGGSSCGKNIGDDPDTTIGTEKQFNYAFQHDERDAFISAVMDEMPKPPTYYPVLKDINKRGANSINGLADPAPMTADDVVDAQEAGALVLDIRDKQAFGDGHIPGATFAGFGDNFQTWMGWLAPYDRDIVLVTDDDGTVSGVVSALRQIGLDRTVGYLDGGMASWNGDIEKLPQMRPEELAERRDEFEVLDVRSGQEWRDGHIRGAAHLFAGDVAQGADLASTLGKHDRIAVICGSGYRSSVAASILQAQGYTNLVNVDGGMSGWTEQGLPVVSAEYEREFAMLRNLFGNTPDPREIANDDASDVFDESGATFVDVREPDEWTSGHIPGARHIPLGDLAQRAGELSPDDRVITVCRSGGRSLEAVDVLNAAGFKDVKSMAGGMNEWKEKGRDVE